MAHSYLVTCRDAIEHTVPLADTLEATGRFVAFKYEGDVVFAVAADEVRTIDVQADAAAQTAYLEAVRKFGKERVDEAVNHALKDLY
jgi:L-aminopeptidase/D-esterase-like protein